MLLQGAYSTVANGIYTHITSKVPVFIRKVILVVGFFSLVCIAFLGNYGDEEVWPQLKDNRPWMFAVVLFLIIVFSVNKKTEKLKWSVPVYLTYALTAILLIVNRFDHYAGDMYFPLGLIMLTEFIWLAFVWGNRADYETLFRYVSIGVVIMNLFLIAICFKNYPYIYDPLKDFHEAGNYWFWHVRNPNGVTKIYLAMVTGAMYMVKTSKKAIPTMICSLILGIDMYITYVTHSRNSVLTFLVFIIFMFVVIILDIRRGAKASAVFRKLWISGICIVLGAVLAYCALVVMQRDAFDKVPYKENAAEKVEDYSEYLDGEYDIYSKEYSYQKQALLKRDHPELVKLDEVMSGRVWIWSMYLEHMDLKGHTKRLGYPPHNQFLLLSWFTGAPTGIVWLIFCIIVGIKLMVSFVRGREWAWFAFGAYMVYIVQAMLEQGLFPMDKPFILLFHLAAMPCFIKPAEKTNNKEKI